MIPVDFNKLVPNRTYFLEISFTEWSLNNTISRKYRGILESTYIDSLTNQRARFCQLNYATHSNQDHHSCPNKMNIYVLNPSNNRYRWRFYMCSYPHFERRLHHEILTSALGLPDDVADKIIQLTKP